MGTLIKINDTLQITNEQGFPKELDFKQHKIKPYQTEDFKDKEFEFKDKSGLRVYQAPPTRNFLVQNIDGKWLYWGLIHITEISHDNISKTTFGKFKIICIYSPEEMKSAHNLIDRNKETDFFN